MQSLRSALGFGSNKKVSNKKAKKSSVPTPSAPPAPRARSLSSSLSSGSDSGSGSSFGARPRSRPQLQSASRSGSGSGPSSDYTAFAAQLHQKYRAELAKVDGIQVDAFPLYPHITSGVALTLPVLFQVKVGDFSEMIKREPAHVCLVIDRSGSMSGKPLDCCKVAARQLIENLGPKDVVSVVIYDTKSEILLKAKTQDSIPQLIEAIDSIQSQGMTNISGALEHAAECLNSLEDGEHQKIVILMSDGQANQGITDINEVGRKVSGFVETSGIQISCMGIGSSYNEEWLQALARTGKGNYFYVANCDEIPDVVNRCLAGFTSVVARNTILRARGCDGHVLKSLQSITDTEILLNGYKINVMRSLGMYQILAYVDVNASADRKEGETSSVLEYELSFESVDPSLNLQPIKGNVEVTYTSNAALLSHKNPAVQCHLAVLDCVPLDHEVEALMNQRKVKEAIAKKQEIIKKYQEVVEMDPFGIVASLLHRAETMVKMLEKQGNSESVMKFQGYSTRAMKKCTKTRAKCAYEDVYSDDDEDMGENCFM